MARTVDFDRYVSACDYPGVLNEEAVTSALQAYLAAVGVTRTVRRLPVEWDLATEEPLRRSVAWILDDLAKRVGWPAIVALNARVASDARDALRRFASWCLCLHRGSWSWWFYTWDLSLIATMLLGAQQLRTEIPWARPIFEAYVAGAWFLYWTDDTLYWVAKPVVHVERLDAGRRLHCETGPALKSDAENLYFWHGVMVPAFVVTRPDWITPEHIQTEDNAEVRRVMLERYGFGRYIQDSGAQLVSEDEIGELYRAELDGDEPLVMVAVKNSTPESDGHFKDYLIRVPPDMQTARQAIAWSFGKDAERYRPVLET